MERHGPRPCSSAAGSRGSHLGLLAGGHEHDALAVSSWYGTRSAAWPGRSGSACSATSAARRRPTWSPRAGRRGGDRGRLGLRGRLRDHAPAAAPAAPGRRAERDGRPATGLTAPLSTRHLESRAVTTTARGELLWEPSEEAVERATITHYLRWLEETRGLRFDDYAALGDGRSRTSRDSGRRSGSCGGGPSSPYEPVLGAARCRGQYGFRGCGLNYAEYSSPRAGVRDGPDRRSRRAPNVDAVVGRARGQVAAVARRACPRSAWAGRPCGRLPAQHRRDRAAFLASAALGAVWSSCRPRVRSPRRPGPAAPRSSRRCC